MTYSRTIELLQEKYLIAVIRGKTADDGYEIARAAIAGGINCIEITFSTPEAISVMVRLMKEFPEALIGAGTVTSVTQAQELVEARIPFMVSPHLDDELLAFASENDIEYLPGCGSVTEVFKAHKAGCSIIKLFPAEVLGPTFIKALHGPFPNIKVMPSGGVSLDNVKEWQKVNACALGVGSVLSKQVKDNDYSSVTEVAKAFVEAIK